MATGTNTLGKVCGERWPRLMPPTWAAAYCGMNLSEFRRSRFSPCIHVVESKEFVDKIELDNQIEIQKDSQNKAKSN